MPLIPPAPESFKRPFQHTVTASVQRFYRTLVIEKLRCCEQLILKRMMELWWRHERKGAPLMPGYAALAKWSGYSLRQIERVMRGLIRRGFLVLAKGGRGRGLKACFAVDFTAIREALAPGSLEPEKPDISGCAYKQITKVARRYWWPAGLLGRSAEFRDRFARALAADARAMWRRFISMDGQSGQTRHAEAGA